MRVALLSGVVLALAAACTPSSEPTEQVQPLDPGSYTLVLRGGTVVDGTGAPPRRADVALNGHRIVTVAGPGVLSPDATVEVVDVSGLVVAPGFLDINGQSDYALLEDGRALSKVYQGVTTEIMGENTTPGPRNHRIVGDLDPLDTLAVRRARDWAEFDGWLEEVEASGTAVNVASFVGASTVRQFAMGLDPSPPTPAELDSMKAVVRRSMRQGALGLASALIYPPGVYAGTDELVALSRVVAEEGGIYISHIRSESAGLLEALDEAIEIGARSGAPVEIYHLKAAGVEYWDLAAPSWEKIDSARAAGVDVEAAMYPYPAASTTLTACFPPWVQANGNLYRNLEDPAARERIVREVLSGPGDWENWCALATPEGTVLVGLTTPGLQEYQGRTLAEVAQLRGVSWIEAAMDLVLEDRTRVTSVFFAMSEENVRRQLTLPWIKFGTDASARDPETARSMTHPRSYGTYPRILGLYVRDEGILPLEDAVRKMTWAVARRVGLIDRGRLARGLAADIVVFDPRTIGENATFTEPHQLSTGIRHLLVNGEFVLRDGVHTGALPGRFLRGPGYDPSGT